MSDQFLSLLSVTARRNTDAAVGLVEEVVTYAPEIERVFGRTIPGNNYLARVRTTLPGGGAFRSANGGVPISASQYVQKRFDCFIFDAALQLDEATVRLADQQGDSAASLMADEAAGALRNKAIDLGKQFYQGTLNDANGFPGLIDFVNTTQVTDAGGSSGSCEVAWFVWMHPQGIHFLFGGNQGLDISPWTKQQVKDSNGNSLMAYVSNIMGFIGLSCAHVRAVGAVKNLDNTLTNDTEAKPLTDKMCWDVYHSFPVGIKPNLVFMSRASVRGLQKQRSVTIMAGLGGQRTGGKVSQVADIPETVCGDVPIVVTDSILTGAANPF